MRFYHVALGIWIFMLTLTMINSLGIFQYKMPTANFDTNSSNAQITLLSSTMSQNNDINTLTSIVGGVGLILNSFGYMKNVFIDSINIVGFADAYQIDRRISIPFQAVYSFTLIFGIYQFLTGRGTKIME